MSKNITRTSVPVLLAFSYSSVTTKEITFEKHGEKHGEKFHSKSSINMLILLLFFLLFHVKTNTDFVVCSELMSCFLHYSPVAMTYKCCHKAGILGNIEKNNLLETEIIIIDEWKVEIKYNVMNI